jgi:hypothetical protein
MEETQKGHATRLQHENVGSLDIPWGPNFELKLARYEMVWTETLRLYNQMIVAEKFPTKSGEGVSFAQFQNLTQRVALCIILSCGFGIPLNWDEKELVVKKEGYKLDDGVRMQSENVLLVVYTPSWISKLPIPKSVCPFDEAILVEADSFAG